VLDHGIGDVYRCPALKNQVFMFFIFLIKIFYFKTRKYYRRIRVQRKAIFGQTFFRKLKNKNRRDNLRLGDIKYALR